MRYSYFIVIGLILLNSQVIFSKVSENGTAIKNISAPETSKETVASNTIDFYSETVNKIQKLPEGAKPLPSCSLKEKQFAIDLLNKSHITELGKKISLITNQNQVGDARYVGHAYNENNEWIDIYKGDFSNEGHTGYAFILETWGTLHTNEVYIYKVIQNRLVKVDLKKIIMNTFFPNANKYNCQSRIADGCGFYNYVAEPFAMIMNGKTYLRYMEYPWGKDMGNKADLLLCTYLWEGEKIHLAKPNFTGDKGDNAELVDATKRCRILWMPGFLNDPQPI